MKTPVAFVLVVFLIGIGATAYFDYPGKEVITPQGVALDRKGKVMSIESYISQNISTLSPIKETVGGKFYVTHVEASGGKGLVSYEDGHNSYTADFRYTMSDLTGIRVSNFVVRN